MHKSFSSSCIVVAILIIYFASLSSATCPWFLRGELYSAQCGVTKEVPRTAGILANDPAAVAVINPEWITVDPKYGTLEVAADGSIVYDPSPDIQPGTYVQFKYNAINGDCAAKYPATDKFLVTCSCKPHVVEAAICSPDSLEQVRAGLLEAGAACYGCGDITPVLDLGQLDLDGNGVPLPGTYDYTIRCGSCHPARGSVTVQPMCQANAPDFSFCQGTVKLEDFMVMAAENASCSGCERNAVPDFSQVMVDEEGYVTGGSYSASCGDGDCLDSDSGTITVIQMCSCELIGFASGACMYPAELEGLILEINPAPCGECDETPQFQFPDWQIDPISGFVEEGVYWINVTCQAEDPQGCDSLCTIPVFFTGCPALPCSCQANAPDVCLFAGASLDEIESEIRSVADCGYCDSELNIDLINVTPGTAGHYQYTLSCGQEGCPVSEDYGYVDINNLV